jgi:hypothetical protein
VVGLNHPSRGALIPTATLVKDPSVGNNFLAPEAALGSLWIADQLSLVATAGEVVGAVEVTINGNKLHQRWRDNDFDGIVDPTPIGTASDGRADSHLTPPVFAPFAAGPTETNTLTGSPLTSTPGAIEYGLGNLFGAWGILTPTATTNLAYIVLKRSDLPFFAVNIQSADPTGHAYPTIFSMSSFKFSDAPTEPEPSTMTLLGLATICGVGRSRWRTADRAPAK